VRRVLICALAVAAAAVGAGSPAAAHQCAQLAEVPVGEPRAIQAGITVEEVAVPDVEVTFPPELRIERVDELPGWKATRSGQTIRYRGGPIAPYTCIYYPVVVTATERGEYPILLVQRDAEGNVVARSVVDPAAKLDPYYVQVVYAGVRPPAPPSSGSGPSATAIAGGALIALALAAAFVLWRRNRAIEHDEDAEPAERLSEFKKRARGR
jgi:hypothetical protein